MEATVFTGTTLALGSALRVEDRGRDQRLSSKKDAFSEHEL